MKIFVLTFLALTASSPAWGSGCGSYNDFRMITETRDEGGADEVSITVLSANHQAAKIRRETGEELTLEPDNEYSYEPSTDSNQPRLHRRDLKFSEGNGCGPVYDCMTGQYVLLVPIEAAKKMRVYTYPSIDQFEHYPSVREQTRWLRESVIPPMLGMTIEGDPSDMKQCVWGLW